MNSRRNLVRQSQERRHTGSQFKMSRRHHNRRRRRRPCITRHVTRLLAYHVRILHYCQPQSRKRCNNKSKCHGRQVQRSMRNRNILMNDVTNGIMRASSNRLVHALQNRHNSSNRRSVQGLDGHRRARQSRHRESRHLRAGTNRTGTKAMFRTRTGRQRRRSRYLGDRTRHPYAYNGHRFTQNPRVGQLFINLTRRRSRYNRSNTTSSVNSNKAPHVKDGVVFNNRGLAGRHVRTMRRRLQRTPRHRHDNRNGRLVVTTTRMRAHRRQYKYNRRRDSNR